MPLNYTVLNDECSLWVLTTGKKRQEGKFHIHTPKKILIYISKKQELWQQSPNLIETVWSYLESRAQDFCWGGWSW